MTDKSEDTGRAKDRKVEEATEPKSKAPKAVRYSRDELITGAAGFDATPALVAGALSETGKESFTRDEVDKALEAFRSKEV